MQLIKLAINRASTANLASPSLGIRPWYRWSLIGFSGCGISLIILKAGIWDFEAKRGRDSGLKICSGRGITIGITGLQENIGRDHLIEVLFGDTPIYTNETIKFQIWPSAIVGAGSFWNYQSKLTPDSKEFAMMIDTQHKVSRYVRFIEQLIIVLT